MSQARGSAGSGRFGPKSGSSGKNNAGKSNQPGSPRGGSDRAATGGTKHRKGESSKGQAASGGRSGGKPPAQPAGARWKHNPPRVRRPAPTQIDVHDPDGIRLQKVLAQAGLGSRRACEELIAAGRVEVDDTIVLDMGVRVDPRRAVVRVDGMRIQLDGTILTLAANKPLGMLSAMADAQGRPTLADLVTDRTERLFHVGRLDVDTEGLILLTNDGELANRLTHPSFEVPKVYLAEIPGPVPRDLGRRLLEGIELEDGLAKVDSFSVVDARPGKALVELTLHDGRNRVVRRLLEEAGHPVLQLVRTQVGPIRLGALRSGRTRVIGGPELGSLMAAVDL